MKKINKMGNLDFILQLACLIAYEISFP